MQLPPGTLHELSTPTQQLFGARAAQLLSTASDTQEEAFVVVEV